ncbi:polymorphic toxin type 50 domain-containing protein [Leptospira dzoumogneensis]
MLNQRRNVHYDKNGDYTIHVTGYRSTLGLIQDNKYEMMSKFYQSAFIGMGYTASTAALITSGGTLGVPLGYMMLGGGVFSTGATVGYVAGRYSNNDPLTTSEKADLAVDFTGSVVGGVTGGPKGTSIGRTLRIANFKKRFGHISKTIHEGKQGKHIRGHNNFRKGNSVLTENAQQLLDDFHAGRVKSAETVNDVKTRVDFGKTIGETVDPKTGKGTVTKKGMIHNSGTGAHIIPSNPN